MQGTEVKDENYWRSIMLQWETGNETQKQFCERLGITRGQFSYWRRITSPRKKLIKNKFIPIQINNTSANTSANQFLSGLEIKTPSGYKITIPLNADLEEIRMLFNLLGIVHA